MCNENTPSSTQYFVSRYTLSKKCEQIENDAKFLYDIITFYYTRCFRPVLTY